MNDQQQLLELTAQWSAALEAKDVDGLVRNYTSETVIFDAIPPYKTVGADNIRSTWEACLPFFPESFRSEHRDFQVHVSGDLAFVYGLHHMIPEPPDHPCGQSWMRVTVCLQRIEGAWTVVHEHISLPFNPMTNEAWQITDPDVLDMPDYAQCGES